MIRSANPAEGLLRPIGEWYVVFTCLVAAVLSHYAYEYLFMSRNLSYVASGFFSILAVVYLRDARRLQIYQRNIRRLRHYEIEPSKIPFSQNYIRLGLGFRWLPIHTQRLRDTFKDQNTEYIVDSELYTRVRNFCTIHKFTPGIRHIVTWLNINSPLNPFRPLPDIGGNPAIHGVEPNEKEFIQKFDERVGHTGVFGATRVGKTRLLELILSSDIRAGAKKLRGSVNDGNVVVVIDPKGDGELLRRCIVECIEADRLDDFYMFHLGFPDLSCEYNPVADFQKITEVAGRSTNQLAGEGNSAVFKEFSWRFVNINAQAMEAVGEEASYQRLVHYVSNPEDILRKYLDKVLADEDPDWGQSVAEIEADIDDKQAAHMGRSKDVLALTNLAKDLLETKEDPIIRGLVGALEYSKSYYDKIVASLLPFLDKMTTGSAKDLLSPGLVGKHGRRRMRWRDVISRRGVVYVGLDALTDPVVAVAVASAMISDLCSVAGEIYKKGSTFDEPKYGKSNKNVPIFLNLDEFNELITGDEIIQILNKSGGAGVIANLFTQTMKDIEAKVGSAAKAAQIIGNLQNLIIMRVKDLSTAELLTEQLPKVEVSSHTEVSGTKDSGELHTFQTDNSDRVTTKEMPMLDPSDLTSLSKGHAFILKNGGELHKVRFPLFKPDRIDLPNSVEEMIAEMKRKYQTGDSWGDRANGRAA